MTNWCENDVLIRGPAKEVKRYKESMYEKDRDTTSGRDPETMGRRRLSTWKPIYDGFRLSTPIDWRCPCGTLLAGSKSCPKCGRVPMDHVATPKPAAIQMRQWRKFGKRYCSSDS